MKSPFFFQKMAGVSNKLNFDLPARQAHRGLWKKGFKENSIPAFLAACSAGFEMCEFDVHTLSDGTIVCYHDNDLQRLENQKFKIADLKPNELCQFQIPTLEEILCHPELLQMKFNIEVKSTKAFDRTLEKNISHLLRKLSERNTPLIGRLLFSSFNPLSLVELSKDWPQIPRALLVSEFSDAQNAWYLKNMAFLPFLDIQFLHLEKSMVDQERIQFFKRRLFKIALWTIQPGDPIEDYYSWGVDSLIVDSEE